MYTKEDYIEKGYVFHGYFPPELSTHKEYPDYIRKPIAEKIQTILQHQNANTFSFALMADLHYAPTYNHHIRLTRALNAYRDIRDTAGVDRLILAGDLGANGCKQFTTTSFNELTKHFQGIDYFPVLGNHDDNSLWQGYIDSSRSEDHFTHHELYDLLFSHLPDLQVKFNRFGTSTYYYFDDHASKVRYVILDISDIPYIMEDGNLKYKGQYTYAYSQEQIDWLIGEALHFEQRGWSVLVVTHNAVFKQSVDPSSDDCSHLGVLNDILCAYKQGTCLCQTFDSDDFLIKIKADFSAVPRADIVGVFCGHYHRDIIEKDEAGICYIATANATMYNHGDHIRKDRTFGEILFDIVTVDKSNRTIHLTRIGYGEDRYVDY